MNKVTTLLTLGIITAVFGTGFMLSHLATPRALSKTDQVHLTCWADDGTSNIERMRLILSSDLHGLVWFSSFDGDEKGEATIAPDKKDSVQSLAGAETNIILNILSSTRSLVAEIPRFVFQPHIKNIQLQIDEDSKVSKLECRKLNLEKQQTASN